MTFSISALVSARDSHIKTDIETEVLIPSLFKLPFHIVSPTYSF